MILILTSFTPLENVTTTTQPGLPDLTLGLSQPFPEILAPSLELPSSSLQFLPPSLELTSPALQLPPSMEHSVQSLPSLELSPPALQFQPSVEHSLNSLPSLDLSPASPDHSPSSQESSTSSPEASASRPRYPCYHPDCKGITFSREGDRTRHARKHDEFKEYFCEMEGCEMRFYRKDKLQSHMRNGH